MIEIGTFTVGEKRSDDSGYSLCVDGKFEVVRAVREGASGFDCKGMAESGLWTGVVLFARRYWGREDKDGIVPPWIGVHEW